MNYIKFLISRFYFFLINKSNRNRILKDYKECIEANPELAKPAIGENEWLARWRRIDKKVSPLSYRIFSRYIGADINILPLETCCIMIEPLLTPFQKADFYLDKNSFSLLYAKDEMPETYIHNVGGIYLDSNFKALEYNLYEYLKKNEIIVKPSTESSGKGLSLFCKKGNQYIDKNGNVLSINYLDSVYHSDFIIQERFVQSQFMEQFNPTSLNTIRIATLRDMKTGKFMYLRGLVRIGGKDAIVDNAHAGGRFIGIDDNGYFGNYVCDNLGRKYVCHNGVDFSSTQFILPNYQRIKEFAIAVSEKFIHHNLLALDIILDKNNNPKILEVNIQGFSAWLFQFTSGTAFREYTSDVMEYCSFNKDKLDISIHSKFINR